LHFQQGKPRREPGIAVTTAYRRRGVRDRFKRKARRGNGFSDPAKARLGSFVYRRRSLVANWDFRGRSGRKGRRFGSGAGFASIAATATASTARTAGRRVGDRSSSILRSGSDNRFKVRGGLFKRQARFRGWQNRRSNRKIVGWSSRLRGSLSAEACGSFLCLGFPVGAAKALRGSGVPFGRFAALPSGLKEFSQFESDHGVASFLIKVGELRRRVFSGASAADPSGNLFPVGHTVRAL